MQLFLHNMNTRDVDKRIKKTDVMPKLDPFSGPYMRIYRYLYMFRLYLFPEQTEYYARDSDSFVAVKIYQIVRDT